MEKCSQWNTILGVYRGNMAMVQCLCSSYHTCMAKHALQCGCYCSQLQKSSLQQCHWWVAKSDCTVSHKHANHWSEDWLAFSSPGCHDLLWSRGAMSVRRVCGVLQCTMDPNVGLHPPFLQASKLLTTYKLPQHKQYWYCKLYRQHLCFKAVIMKLTS